MSHCSRSRLVVPVLCSTLVFTGVAGVAHAQRAAFSGLGDLEGGPVFSQVSAISPDGSTVVGRSAAVPPEGFSQALEAFLWNGAAGMVRLGDLNGGTVQSWAQAVAENRTHVTGTTDSGAFLWTPEAGMLELAAPPGGVFSLLPTVICADGSVVAGIASVFTGGTVGFRWTEAGGVEDLGALPSMLGVPDAQVFDISHDGAVISGAGISGAFDVETTRWTRGTGLVGLGDVPGGAFYSLGFAVSGDGRTQGGGARSGFDNDEAFLWTAAGGFELLDPLRGAAGGSTVYALSHDGSVAIGTADMLGGAMVWTRRRGMRSIRTILERAGLDLDGWLIGAATDVSADGRVVVGNGLNPDGDTEAWRAVLPGGPILRGRQGPLVPGR